MADACGEVSLLLGELRLVRNDAIDRLIPLAYRELSRVADCGAGALGNAPQAVEPGWALGEDCIQSQLVPGGRR